MPYGAHPGRQQAGAFLDLACGIDSQRLPLIGIGAVGDPPLGTREPGSESTWLTSRSWPPGYGC
jgi:hypothetical protein